MLCLQLHPMGRKKQEDADYILIDGRIKIYFIELKGANVRLGIDAPRDVTICRRVHVEP